MPLQRFKVDRLTAKTPRSEQSRLLFALQAVSGVERAILHPQSNEFEIKPSAQREPTRADISAAAFRAGFVVTDRA